MTVPSGNGSTRAVAASTSTVRVAGVRVSTVSVATIAASAAAIDRAASRARPFFRLRRRATRCSRSAGGSSSAGTSAPTSRRREARRSSTALRIAALLAHSREPARDLRLHGAQGDLEHARDLLLRHVVVVAQHERGALLHGQAAECNEQRVTRGDVDGLDDERTARRCCGRAASLLPGAENTTSQGSRRRASGTS